MKNGLVLSIVVFVFMGCTQIGPYRTELELGAPPCAAPADCSTAALFRTSENENGPGVMLGVVEFDDQGAMHSRTSKNFIMSEFREVAENKGALIVVFAHGWLNNAAPDNGNLTNFKKMLSAIAAHDKRLCEGRSCEGREVLGLFLGWRGMSATLQPFKSLSFWNRKTRAHRVGQDGATEVLAELAKIKAVKTNAKPGGKPRKLSSLILIGHSFGGALVYSATQQLLMKDTAEPKPGVSVPRRTADLVMLVNPAFEAARLTSLREKAATMTFPTTQSPVLAIFTSESDDATKLAFPLGRRFSTLWTKYNPERKDQKELDRTAVGHFGAYQTHRLELQDARSEIASWEKSVCGWENFRDPDSPDGTWDWDLEKVVLRRNERTSQNGQQVNPYYNVVVDEDIISDHTKIWSESFMEFVYRFIAVQSQRSCSAYRT